MISSSFMGKKCVDILEGIGVTRIGPDMSQVEAGGFIGYPACGAAHDLTNTAAHQI
jgi:uncharacterized cupin superfamily protein